ncbi:hypothetical protein O181_006649 [Austropuccinia psidii MF-1]|uniref:K Homology domain-containing protein n=1 Tax=Austropuccinia psidii MF-1 TaxID=1389203 RepID=A0A9Q3BJL3_9BASI|nr:hypothetical protein [Austropuccinia psidii MF-1]
MNALQSINQPLSNNDNPILSQSENISSAERLMLQHQQKHLSYDQMRSFDQINLNSKSSVLPSEINNPTTSKSISNKKIQPDFDSEVAFPSLGNPSAPPKTATGWGTGPALGDRTLGSNHSKLQTSSNNQFTETLVLLLASIHIGPVPPQYRERGPRQAGEKREEDPKTLPEVLRVIQKRHPTVTVESSTSRDRVTILFRTPFILPPPTSSTPSLIRTVHNLSPEERVLRARQELITRVTRKIEKVIKIPALVKPFLIGHKARVLKEIIEITGATINLSSKHDSRPVTFDSATDNLTNHQSDLELIPLTINGEESAVLDAQDRIMMIVKEHTNKISAKINSIPFQLYPLLDGPSSKGSKLLVSTLCALIKNLGIKEEDLNCQVNVPPISQIFKSQPAHFCLIDSQQFNQLPRSIDSNLNQSSFPITISGDRDQVQYAVKLIESTYENMAQTLTKVEVELPKRQHRFLDISVVEEILESTGSIVILPPLCGPSEKVIIKGEKMSNVQALGLVVTKANAFEVETIDLKAIYTKTPDPLTYYRQLVAYLSIKVNQTQLKQIQDDWINKGIKIYIPFCSGPFSTIDVVGKDAESVKKVKEIISSYIKDVMRPAFFESIEVDTVLSRHILNKNPQLKTLLDQHEVEFVVPTDDASSPSLCVLASNKAIIHKGPKAVNQGDITLELRKVKQELYNSIKNLAEVKSAQLEIPQNLHHHIIGTNQNTLKGIIGKDQLVSVQIGAENQPALVTIRGIKDEVERVQKEIKRIIEENDMEANRSHSIEFELDSKSVNLLLTKSKSVISKLSEELNVKIEFKDLIKSNSKKDQITDHNDLPQMNTNNKTLLNKKRPQQNNNNQSPSNFLVSIFGKSEDNLQKAKQGILNQAERLADEVTVSLPLLAGLNRMSLVGKGGKYILRLQDTHMVQINIPRVNSDDNLITTDSDHITIRGPRKGVDAARKELIELMDYEREHGNSLSINVPAKSVSHIIGKGGAQLEKIRADSGIQSLDVDKVQEPNGLHRLTLIGTKTAILAAKKMINALVQEVDEVGEVEMKIPRAYCLGIIGRGGARLRELVQLAGGDESAAKQIHFSRSQCDGNGDEIVRIKGRKTLVPKIQHQLELEVAKLMNQSTLGVHVPKPRQAFAIGKGGSRLKALQTKYQVQVLTPNWKDWSLADEPINSEELKDVSADEIFKVIGDKKACLLAIEEFKAQVLSERPKIMKKTIMVPLEFHYALIGPHNVPFSRGIPKGVRLDHGNFVIPNPFLQITESFDESERDGGEPTMSRIDFEESHETRDKNERGKPIILGFKVEKVDYGGIEVPWNLSTFNEEKLLEVENKIQHLREIQSGQLNDQSSVKEEIMMLNYLGIVKVKSEMMPKIIGKSGLELRKLTDFINDHQDNNENNNKNGKIKVDIVGKTNSNKLKIFSNNKDLILKFKDLLNNLNF